MTPEVRVSEFAASKIAAEYGPERSTAGEPSEWDFWSGPLAAALLGFRDFENLLWHPRPEIRSLHSSPLSLALWCSSMCLERPAGRAALTGLPQKR